MTGMPYVVQAGSILNGIANYWEDQTDGRARMVEALIDCLDPDTSFAHVRGFHFAPTPS